MIKFNKLLNTFKNHNMYEECMNFIGRYNPTVGHCLEPNEVHYNPIDFSTHYMTTVALESGTISFNILRAMNTDMITSISYSLDEGETWTTVENTDNKSSKLTINVEVNADDEILWKGDAKRLGYYDGGEADGHVGSFFSSTCQFEAKGNIMSLCYGDDFIREDTLEYDGQFARLFNDWEMSSDCKVVNATDLSLPATRLTKGCYEYMFRNCYGLATAPKLPAEIMQERCYYGMFYGCISLKKAPKLPSTELHMRCYESMFNGCVLLTDAPDLPATVMDRRSYAYMFTDCISLINAPELPADTLLDSCYEGMFSNCKSLVVSPELPSTILADSCYNSMFAGCTALTITPSVLPATLLTYGCYESMFSGCTSLITAPELPATTLTNNCYYGMFRNCSNLNYIKALFTTTPSNTYTEDWVYGVAESGTFVKNGGAQWDVTGDNGVPSGWTVQTVDVLIIPGE